MNFTDRAMLVGLVAVAIPVAVHFAGRRPPRVVLLPTARFAEGAQADSRARSVLRRVLLLASRMAVVALLVLALAGPRTGGAPRENLAAGATAASSSSRAATPEGTAANSAAVAPLSGKGMAARAPIKVLVVDAADEKDAKVRSADLVAAALAGDTLRPKKVWRKIDFKPTSDETILPSDIEVEFWVGSCPPGSVIQVPCYVLGAKSLVWVPADAAPPSDFLAKFLKLEVGGVEDVPAGATIDPDNYTSNLLGAFEAGTSGDLGAPVFRRRMVLQGPAVLKFRDGRPAATEHTVTFNENLSRPLTLRVVTLAVGPAPAWGDLASRAEFVVLINSLAEALGPKVHATGATAAPSAAVPSGDSPRLPDNATVAPRLAEATAPPGADLTLWCVLGLAVMLVVEGLLAAPRRK